MENSEIFQLEPTPIEETLTHAKDGHLARIIRVETQTSPLVLLSAKSGIPAAFVLWSQLRISYRRDRICFRSELPEDQAGEGSEQSKRILEHTLVYTGDFGGASTGSPKPVGLALDEEEWNDVVYGRICRAVRKACKENSIHTLFVYGERCWANLLHARRWDDPGIGISLHVLEYTEAMRYNLHVDSAFPFIDWEKTPFNPTPSVHRSNNR